MKAVLLFLILSLCFSCQPSESKNLFNGYNLEGWHIDIPAMDSIPSAKTPFIVEDEMLISLGTPQGHLITDESYENFRLNIEYRFTGTPRNCGVLVFASTPRSLYQMFPKSIEVQMMHENAGDFWCIVEDITTDDMIARRGAKEEWGITEGKKRRIKNLTDSSENPLGEWNYMTIECVNNAIKVWVNSDLVNHGYNATVSSGQIALQAEGAVVAFRKVQLTSISEFSK